MPVDLGDLYPLTVEIRDANGVLAAPGAITLTITLPDQTTATPSPSNPSTGKYQYDYPTTQAGRHIARWLATGQNAGAYVDSFDVRPASPGYIVSLADAKRHLNITTTTNDEQLRTFIEAATAAVEGHVNKAVIVRSFTEVHDGGYAIALNRTPVISVTTLAPVYTGGTSYLPADLTIASSSGMISLLSGAVLRGPLTITYVAGMPVIPANYTLAAHIIIQHLWQTVRGSGVGSARAYGAEGESEFLTGTGFSIPHRALELLGSSVSGIA